MNNMPEFELPGDADKLSSRFILESVRKKYLAPKQEEPLPDTKEQRLEPVQEEAKPLEPANHANSSDADQGEELSLSEVTETSEEQCGTQAPLPTLDEVEPELSCPLEPLDLPLGKKYFRVSEVSELIGVEPYVLRYWQSEFSTVRPFKSASGHWVYSRKDVEALHMIRHLLHVEKYSIKGAKKRLRERKVQINTISLEQEQKTVETLKVLVKELKDLVQIVKEDPGC